MVSTSADLIVFLCDATPAIGWGHLSRCVALAEAFEDLGYAAHFLGRYEGGAETILVEAGLSFAPCRLPMGNDDLPEKLSHLRTMRPVGIVADDYHVDAAYLAELREFGAPVLFVDDFCALRAYSCDAVLNPAVDVSAFTYPAGVVTLLGADYLPVRRGLRALRQQRSPRVGVVRRVLVAIGGVDRHDLTRRVLGALCIIAAQPGKDKKSPSDRTPFDVRVVAGMNLPELDILEASLQAFGPDSSLVVQAPSLATHLDWADCCISGGGMIKYEAAYLGVPPIVISKSREEAGESVLFARGGFGIDLGYGPDLSDDALRVGIQGAIVESTLLGRIRQRGLDVFPFDSTLRAARGFIDVMSRNSRSG